MPNPEIISVEWRRGVALKTDQNKTWDPGGVDREANSYKIAVNGRIYSLFARATIGDLNGAEDDRPTTGTEDSRTELDSHANMPVIGQHCYVIFDTGKIADVNAF